MTERWRFASKHLADEPTAVIMNGKLIETAMGATRYGAFELLEQLRRKGVFRWSLRFSKPMDCSQCPRRSSASLLSRVL